jgi:hypothetical protein
VHDGHGLLACNHSRPSSRASRRGSKKLWGASTQSLNATPTATSCAAERAAEPDGEIQSVREGSERCGDPFQRGSDGALGMCRAAHSARSRLGKSGLRVMTLGK